MQRRFDHTNVNQVPGAHLDLVFWIRPVDGVSYRVDLESFRDPTGRSDGSSRPPRRANDFKGREVHARGLARILCDDQAPHTTYVAKRHALRTFLRFLQDVDPEENYDFPEFLTDEIGLQLQSWLNRKGSGEYPQIRGLVARIRAVTPPIIVEEHLPLLWPPQQAVEVARQKDITLRAVRDLNLAFVKEAMSIKAMFAEGHRLAADGRDPRIQREETPEEAWKSPANHAWLANEVLSTAVANGRARRVVFHGPSLEPSHLALGMKAIEEHNIARKLRWFTFGRRDAIVFLWLFLLKTGWNLSTALALDVSTDESWCHVDRLSARHRTIRALKARAGKLQFATCLEEPPWHPYQVVRFMVEKTESLRAILRHRLAEAVLRRATDKSTEHERRIGELEADLRSPWLYVTSNGGVSAARLRPSDGQAINEISRLIVARDELKHPELSDWVASDARDAWIRLSYEMSDFDVAVAQAAAQHATLRTSKHYLGAASLDGPGEKRFRAMQSTIFADLDEGRPLDLTRLRILVERGTITPEQENSLRDLRMRTKVGMGCLDARNPPKAIAPGHPPDEPCAVQRCACCPHGVVFEDSLPALAKRAVELRLIQAIVPHGSWLGSSMKEEVEAIEATLGTFDSDDVQVAIAAWQTRFERGDAVIQDTFPSYR